MKAPQLLTRGARQGMDLAYDAGSYLGQISSVVSIAPLRILQSKHVNSGKIAVVHTEHGAVRKALRYGVVLKTYHDPQTMPIAQSAPQQKDSQTLPVLLAHKRCAKPSMKTASTIHIHQKDLPVCDNCKGNITIADDSAPEGQIITRSDDDVVGRTIGFVCGSMLSIPGVLVGTVVGGLKGLTEDVGEMVLPSKATVLPSEVKPEQGAVGGLSVITPDARVTGTYGANVSC